MMQITQRGRVARWTREKLDTLSTQELRQLYVNAQRLQETERGGQSRNRLDRRDAGKHHQRQRRREQRNAVGKRTDQARRNRGRRGSSATGRCAGSPKRA